MIRCSAAEAIARYLAAQEIEKDGHRLPLFGGVGAIFGHGNVGGLGQALGLVEDRLPTFRGHDEQGLGHMALGFAKAWRRRRMMAVTTSIGPGATNLVTAAATGHVNRLPILLLPGDVFGDRRPDPVLQQLQHPLGPDVTVNDCLRPVSRYFDRILRGEQLLDALPEALRVLTDPVEAGPVTLALPQDVQAEQVVFPSSFFAHRLHVRRRPVPEPEILAEAARRLDNADRVLVIAGGGVRYAESEVALRRLVESRAWPVAFTHAGKGSLPAGHPLDVGGVGVTGTSAANQLFREADAVLVVGSRLSDFTTASGRLLPRPGLSLIHVNLDAGDAHRRGGFAVIGDAGRALESLLEHLSPRVEPAWAARVSELRAHWVEEVENAFAQASGPLPGDAEVLRQLAGLLRPRPRVSVVAAAGGIPGDLHKLWPAQDLDGYLVEYGYSCMGHEIAGALGVKMGLPHREVWALLGDGSYLMMSSELATSVAMDHPIRVLVLDNQGFGCIDRLDRSLRGSGAGAPGNLRSAPFVDIVAHAQALGASARRVDLDGFSSGVAWARAEPKSAVLVVDTDPAPGPTVGGAPWRVPSMELGA